MGLLTAWLSQFINDNGVFLYLLSLTTAGWRYSGETKGRREEERRLRRSGADAVTFFKPLFPESSETQPFPRQVLWKPGNSLPKQCAPDETSSCRCCFCTSACLEGWKEVEERTELLLPGGGFCAKGLSQGNGCPLAENILSYCCFHRQTAVNCRAVWGRKNDETKVPSLGFQTKAKVKSWRLRALQYFLKQRYSCCQAHFCLLSSASLLGISLLLDLVIFGVRGR